MLKAALCYRKKCHILRVVILRDPKNLVSRRAFSFKQMLRPPRRAQYAGFRDAGVTYFGYATLEAISKPSWKLLICLTKPE